MRLSHSAPLSYARDSLVAFAVGCAQRFRHAGDGSAVEKHVKLTFAIALEPVPRSTESFPLHLYAALENLQIA